MASRYLASVTVLHPPRSVRVLLGQAIDYAGLFPPAGLPLDRAASNYAAYRASADAWALGRFVCPAERLPQLAAALDATDGEAPAEPWRVSATLGEDWPADWARIQRFNRRADAQVDAVEGRTPDAGAVRHLAAFADEGIAAYGEVPLDAGCGPVIEALRAAALAAKIRMGGVTPERFPVPDRVAAFLAEAAAAAIPFKATAGLHHAFRGEYPLTYDAGSPWGTMYGYLNLMVAALAARAGAAASDVVAALEERAPAAFQLDETGVAWRGFQGDLAALHGFRVAFHGFGSCSFREPIEALLGLQP